MPFPSINAGGLECLSWLGSSSGCGAEGGEKTHQRMGSEEEQKRRGLRRKERGRDRAGQRFVYQAGQERFTYSSHFEMKFCVNVINLPVVNSSLINFRDIERIYKFLQAYD